MLVVFFAIILVQVVFLLFFLTSLGRKPVPGDESVLHPVSLLVCAHDELDNLRELIPLLLAQDHPQFEVIIVNDRSNDHTYDFLLEAVKTDDRLKMVNVTHLPDRMHGKKYGITLGIKAARYEIILVTDADCRPQSNRWIHTMSQRFNAETDFVLGYSPYFRKAGFLNLFIRFETLLTGIQYLSFALVGIPYMGVGRNLAYRKSMFLQVKGFTDTLPLVGGDDDLFVNRYASRANTAVCIGSESITYSKPKDTWREFFWQKVRHLSAGKHYRTRHKFMLMCFSMTYLATWIVGIALMLTSVDWIYVVSALAIRTILLGITTAVAAKRFGHKFESWTIPVLDIVYAIYYLSTGWMALVTKKVPWRI